MKKYLFSLVLLSASITCACFHYPGSFKNKMTEGRKSVFLFHDGENAHMVIQTTLRAKKFPSELAWVLPFPSLPNKYEEINGPFFQELQSILPRKMMLGQKGLPASAFGDGRGGGGGIKVHETVVFDQYKIQPIEILKDNSAAEFNSWLKKNKFNPMPFENQKYYLKKGAVFLAIRMQLNNPTATELTARPLHIVYKSDRVSVPLKFTHDARTFDLELYVFSKKELNVDLSRTYLKKQDSVAYRNERLHPFVDSIVGKKEGYISRYEGEELNTKEKSLKDLKDDPLFLADDL